MLAYFFKEADLNVLGPRTQLARLYICAMPILLRTFVHRTTTSQVSLCSGNLKMYCITYLCTVYDLLPKHSVHIACCKIFFTCVVVMKQLPCVVVIKQLPWYFNNDSMSMYIIKSHNKTVKSAFSHSCCLI